MMKWLLAVLLLVLTGLTLWWQMNTTKISYVNGLDRYADLPNQEYILELDTYVFAWHEHIATAYPLLGVNHPGSPASVRELPREVSADNIGKALPSVRLMSAIPKGTRFRILSVRREEKRNTPTFISYEIKLLDEVERPYQRVDIRPILLPVDHPGDVPLIDPTIAVPWIKR